MSQLFNNLKSSTTAPATNWYLRVGGDLVHGPVPFDDLRLWATEGRITAASEVSTDRITWQAAPDLAELQMHWTSTLKSGRRVGPFNRAATAKLVEKGLLDPDGTMRHALTGESVEIARVIDTVEALPPPPPASYRVR